MRKQTTVLTGCLAASAKYALSNYDGAISMARTYRYREYIAKVLQEEGPMATGQIMQKCIDHFKNPPTMQQLGNIMSKDKRFHKHGFETVTRDTTTRSYVTMVWAHVSLYEDAKTEAE